MNKLFFLFAIIAFVSCKRNSQSSVVPKITYKSMEPKILKAGASSGGTSISFFIEDGDGDIGYDTENLFLKDSRDTSGKLIKMKIPVIPGEYGPDKGLKATVSIDYLSALLLLRSDTAHLNTDTLHWEIYMKDKTGHTSNTIFTDDLILVK